MAKFTTPEGRLTLLLNTLRNNNNLLRGQFYYPNSPLALVAEQSENIIRYFEALVQYLESSTHS